MNTAEKATVISVPIAVVGAVITLLAWQFPRPTADPSPRLPRAASPSTVGTTGATAQPDSGPSVSSSGTPLKYLDTIEAQSGAGYLRQLPRALTGRPGYDHPIVIACTQNTAADKVHEVTYSLRGRYLDFSATVRPYFNELKDSKVWVYAVVGTQQRDGTINRVGKGNQLDATMDAPAPVKASVEGGQELTIQVRCEWPDGVVVLTAAALTPTG
jgi:hypothetical protein